MNRIARQPTSWTKFLEREMEDLLTKEPLPFGILKPSMLPQEPGVYLLTDHRNPKNEIASYIGRSKNLQQRIYTNHLHGGLGNARLKKYLVGDPIQKQIRNKDEAKAFLKANVSLRWIILEDLRERGCFEGYLTGVLKPVYGIYEEH